MEPSQRIGAISISLVGVFGAMLLANCAEEKAMETPGGDGGALGTGSQKLSDAAKILAVEPVTITLRYLQTLAELGTEKNTTIVFPIPVELLSILMQKVNEPPAREDSGKA